MSFGRKRTVGILVAIGTFGLLFAWNAIRTNLSAPPNAAVSEGDARQIPLPATAGHGKTVSQIPPGMEGHIRSLAGFALPSQRSELMRLLQSYGGMGPSSLPLLLEFLGHHDQDVRRASMRGIAATQAEGAVAVLAGYLRDGVAIEESTEAALALATMEREAATSSLIDALEPAKDAVLREHIIDALAARPPAQNSAFIDGFLRGANTAPEEKQNLLRMAGLNDSKTSAYISAFLWDPSEPVRLGAYQGLAVVTGSRQYNALRGKLDTEKNPFNRGLVYEALGNQQDADTATLGLLADSEPDSYTRLRALRAWSESLGRAKNPLQADPKSAQRLSELVDAAMNHGDFSERRFALLSLAMLGHDPAAKTAVAKVAAESDSKKIGTLARGILEKIQ
jgi:HEAT repeat protein